MKFDLSHVHQIYSLRYNSRFLRVAPLRMANIEEVIVLITVGPLCIQEFMNSLITYVRKNELGHSILSKLQIILMVL